MRTITGTEVRETFAKTAECRELEETLSKAFLSAIVEPLRNLFLSYMIDPFTGHEYDDEGNPVPPPTCVKPKEHAPGCECKSLGYKETK